MPQEIAQSLVFISAVLLKADCGALCVSVCVCTRVCIYIFMCEDSASAVIRGCHTRLRSQKDCF